VMERREGDLAAGAVQDAGLMRNILKARKEKNEVKMTKFGNGIHVIICLKPETELFGCDSRWSNVKSVLIKAGKTWHRQRKRNGS